MKTLRRFIAVGLALSILGLPYPAVLRSQSPANTMSPVGPAPIEITQGDILTLNVTGQVGVPAGYSQGVQYYVTYRMKLTDGTIRTTFQGPITFTAGAGGTTTWPLPAGWLLSVTVGQQVGLQRGAILTQVFVGKPVYAQNNVSEPLNYMDYCLIATTMAGFQTVTWPMHQPQQSSDGPGSLISYTISNPATATNFTKTFTNGYRVKVVNIYFQLVTSATAGTRQVCLTFTDGTTSTVFAHPCVQATQAVSLIVGYNFAVAVGPDFAGAATLTAIPSTNVLATSNNVNVPLPFNLGWNDATIVASSIIGLTTGDQIQNIVIRTETWHDFT